MITIEVPSSKSITNRVLLLAALAKAKSTIKNALVSDDTSYMRQALKVVGSLAAARPSGKPIFCGNAGTVMRFLAAILATKSFPGILTGNKRMSERPISDLVDALRKLGAEITYLKKQGFPPIRVRGPLKGGICRVNGKISSQFLSGLLMAAPFALRDTYIKVIGDLVSKPYVDMTINLMREFGVKVKRDGYKKFFIKAGQKYKSRTFSVEGDASSASYFWGISALTGIPIEITNIPKNSLQADVIPAKTGIYKKIINGFPIESGMTIDCSNFPDSAMTLATLAAFRKGKTRLTGLSNLRIKECDRLHALKNALRKIGCRVKEQKDGFLIRGDPDRLHGGRIKTEHDHRMAMCFGMAGFVLPGITVDDAKCVAKTYPRFWKDLAMLKEKFRSFNIILTGMRGSGKTKLGKLLGRILGRRFIDIDEFIEWKAKKTIAEIVEERGWRYFRMLERRAVRLLQNVKHAVISTGGGTLMYPSNAAALKKNGRVIFLDCPVKTLQKRVSGDYTRPALLENKNHVKELNILYQKRIKRYSAVANAYINVGIHTWDKKRDLLKKLAQLVRVVERWGMA